MELFLVQPTELDHLLQRDPLLARRSALAWRAQLLDLRQETLDARLEAVRLFQAERVEV